MEQKSHPPTYHHQCIQIFIHLYTHWNHMLDPLNFVYNIQYNIAEPKWKKNNTQDLVNNEYSLKTIEMDDFCNVLKNFNGTT